MTPEAEHYLEKAQQCLSNARAELDIRLSNDAGRNAYLAVFHAAQALIFERTGKVAKTDRGVHSEFANLHDWRRTTRTSTRAFRSFSRNPTI